MRKTKIVCTLGPATSSETGIEGLIRAGANVIRLNFSHGDHESHRQAIRRIRRVAEELGRPVAILQDLQGPKIRLGEIPGGEILLSPHEEIDLVAEGVDSPGALPVSYRWLAEDVAEGDRILLADGSVELEALSIGDARVRCRVVAGGPISSRKGVNLPGSELRIPSFTEKDRLDLELGCSEGVDLVALSFVRHEDDLKPVIEVLQSHSGARILVVAKIEKPQAVDRLDRILATVDGVMVARGDLGVEMPIEEVPLIQKKIIEAARLAARPVITATQMLRSMVENPRPTRAEASDVANAVLDGTDAVMLSEESAVGRYPTESVDFLDRIARSAENSLDPLGLVKRPLPTDTPSRSTAIGRSACLLAHDVGAKAIVATTTSGSTARILASFRPGVPIVGLTSDQKVMRQLNLSWGVRPALTEVFSNTDDLFSQAREWCSEHGLARPGDAIVVTAGLPIAETGTTNVLRVVEV
ncbi:MAG: pyruvate kinase [Thermoanaerobaculales bacterium]|nr:pyruvate kinase [Thermoanaerobaculales bacterium]